MSSAQLYDIISRIEVNCPKVPFPVTRPIWFIPCCCLSMFYLLSYRSNNPNQNASLLQACDKLAASLFRLSKLTWKIALACASLQAFVLVRCKLALACASLQYCIKVVQACTSLRKLAIWCSLSCQSYILPEPIS
jgi:hypothetical protein